MLKLNLTKIIILLLGIILSLSPDILNLNKGLDPDAKIVIRMVIIMVFLWLTEIIPISITALLPILYNQLNQYVSISTFL